MRIPDHQAFNAVRVAQLDTPPRVLPGVPEVRPAKIVQPFHARHMVGPGAESQYVPRLMNNQHPQAKPIPSVVLPPVRAAIHAGNLPCPLSKEHHPFGAVAPTSIVAVRQTVAESDM